MRLGRRLVWGAGFVLIALGIGALIWSHQLSLRANSAANEWWQSTWQALGVGLVVGGLVDVLAITGLNRATEAEDRRRKGLNDGIRDLLSQPPPSDLNEAQSLAVKSLIVNQIVRDPRVFGDLDPDVLRALDDPGSWKELAAGQWRTPSGPPEDNGQNGGAGNPS